MTGNVDAWSVEPVANPRLREAKRRRLVRMAKEQIVGRTGPVRQIRHRDELVSPLALELECRTLVQRCQRAISTIVTSPVYAGDLRGAVDEPVLRQHEWEIAIALREITELLLDLVGSYAGGTAGPMTTAILASQNRANDRYLDLVARTAADQHAVVEITDLAGQAAQSALAFKQTLEQATLAAEALALPESR